MVDGTDGVVTGAKFDAAVMIAVLVVAGKSESPRRVEAAVAGDWLLDGAEAGGVVDKGAVEIAGAAVEDDLADDPVPDVAKEVGVVSEADSVGPGTDVDVVTGGFVTDAIELATSFTREEADAAGTDVVVTGLSGVVVETGVVAGTEAAVFGTGLGVVVAAAEVVVVAGSVS